MTEIVKVQLPLASTIPDAKPLIYGKDRRNLRLQYLDKATRLLMGDDVKAFFYATFAKGEWQIGARAPDQDW